ncbi:AarF/ABC1/UbiB kinase family protein [Synechococcus sp. Cruz-9H2]|uniref:ABC1 kinase family protein n=1 Tax=unclassified Synechococcus TaxID=2626047 RepID=UPI0020CDAA7D|nr:MULTISPECIES: AarF/ABC1/UbiB kinase family protein [unclassified Synechococcus]MCP9818882.1 AarF/ABC1/UbiB kinase family protein [Synechococcus sp. Cruz-9H2]MCP9843385.1 AarF/ABC1/UbiB kinase family protein [Synechococcus sp. Edmonson 11F2]MCP9855232.1 AarF/ABC1/UbiB kinase family protein [Synechococcus sp. Cruz-9C9]MCP9862795.1 AarF/ABC1/UbiB kinase family protein [Synechococcus sp. Cruz-7E5]MCP9869792.1 AarF/ABC1/UbiB kinase family protein [Synechococcus sp. Cruz-7B9]
MGTLRQQWRALARSLRIWSAVLSLVAGLWWDGKDWTYPGGVSEQRRQERQQRRARWLTNELISLGSAFIKLGQLLSARPDVLPAGYVEELAHLQDRVPAFPFVTVQALLEQELGERCAEIIDLEEQPLGSASLAQVHRASLRSGRQVVFKIQRPGLERLFRLDLEVMQQVAAVMQRHPRWGEGRDWVSIAQECRRVLLRELDFRLEAEHAARFRQQFFDDAGIRIPSVIWELSTRRVLCLDFLPGIKITDRSALVEAGIDPAAVAEKGAASYLQQLVRFGFFHADPHPGNLAVAADGALIYYDFGMMGQISQRLRSRLGRMVRAAAARDASALVVELQGAGVIAAGIDPGPVRRLVRVMLTEALTPPFSANILEKLSGDLYDLVYGQPFRLPSELIFVMRALSTFEGVGRSLDPGFSLVSIARPYLLPLMTASGNGPNDFLGELGRQAGDLGSRALGIPRRLDDSLARIEQGDLQVQIRAGETDRLLRRLALAQQVSGQSFLLGGLAVAAALLASGPIPALVAVPLVLAAPVALSWLKLQGRLRRDARLEKLPGTSGGGS